jgi:transglutaminase-like putative cysteine protease
VRFSISDPTVEQGVGGDTVTQRVLRCVSQPEQIRRLRDMVEQYSQTYAIRSRARDIVFRQWPTAPKDKRGQAIAIGEWVQRNITYVEEYPEVFQTPLHTVACGYGDCDDGNSLIGALLESIGIDCELWGLSWRDEYRHIFPVAVVPGPARLPLDWSLNYPVSYLTDPVRIAQERYGDVRVFVG